MKKFFALAGISFIFLLGSCDDGNLIYKDIDFNKVTAVQKCTTPGAEKIFYKLQNDEALILVVDADNIMRDESEDIGAAEIDGVNTTLEYRKYNAQVSGTSICNLPPPATPSVIQNIPASPGGTVVINRNIQITNTTTQANNAVALVYQYIFTLENINFSEGQTNIKYDRMLFGTTNYANRTLAFTFNNNNNNGLNDYNCNNALVTLSNQEALILNLTEADLPTQETTTDKIIELTSERFASFRQYERGGINVSQICNNPGNIPGSNPNNPNRLIELWLAPKGQIAISTRETKPVDGSPSKLLHTIKLVNTTFIKASNTEKTFVKPSLDFGTYLTDKQ
ncbi:hypothetical protein LNQ81_12615 [Myroides sp. M-43]|uniref:hypothetical protein n=1 Tax=Myroides oncorhynchi TaxID=2893756 RepID=UPI001E3BADBF|nr:hypothetical protein [Myroides oncorhynchi]MCC9043515.1 hypothetical protein [Myroides oncorhynchi]